jgi:uncharacterized peroxidase-related enzyme
VTVRLGILDHGHRFGTKILFAFIRAFSRQPTPEPLKLLSYRPEFFGDWMRKITQEAMRGASPWSVADRELMAAVVSQANECEYCIKAHTAVSVAAYGNEEKVMAALTNLDVAAIDEPLRATLQMLRRLTLHHTIGVDDVRVALAAGASKQQLADALAVAFAFNVTNRLADAFGFSVPGPGTFRAGAKFLLAHGYK